MASIATKASREPFAWNNFGQLQSVFDAATNETTTYSYDLYGNLLAVALPDGRTIEYEVDGAGRRVGRREFDADGVQVSFRGWIYRDLLRPIAEVDELGNVVARYVYGEGGVERQSPIGQLKARLGLGQDESLPDASSNAPDFIEFVDAAGSVTQTLAVSRNQVGSVELVTDVNSGVVLQRIEYDSFGRVVFDSEPGLQPFGFAGGLYESETNLVRFGARDYEPNTGRWTGRDPIRFEGSEERLYQYANGDPLNYVDPTGQIFSLIECLYRLWDIGEETKECEKEQREACEDYTSCECDAFGGPGGGAKFNCINKKTGGGYTKMAAACGRAGFGRYGSGKGLPIPKK